nr:hypothetical protein [Streptomyces sp. AK02-04a]
MSRPDVVDDVVAGLGGFDRGTEQPEVSNRRIVDPEEAVPVRRGFGAGSEAMTTSRMPIVVVNGPQDPTRTMFCTSYSVKSSLT